MRSLKIVGFRWENGMHWMYSINGYAFQSFSVLEKRRVNDRDCHLVIGSLLDHYSIIDIQIFNVTMENLGLLSGKDEVAYVCKFPLEIGSSYKSKPDQNGKVSITEVKEKEFLSTPIGEVACYRIELYDQAQGVTTFWYSDQVKWHARIRRYDGTEIDLIEHRILNFDQIMSEFHNYIENMVKSSDSIIRVRAIPPLVEIFSLTTDIKSKYLLHELMEDKDEIVSKKAEEGLKSIGG